MSATDRLIHALKQLPPSSDREYMIKKASQLAYHDFDSQYPFPRKELIKDLNHIWDYAAELLLERIKRGEFNARRTRRTL